jgi:phage-related baseplate assembly protein
MADFEKKLLRVLAVGLIALFLVLIVFAVIKKHAYEKTIAELHNQAAKSAATVEEQKGLYTKLTVQSDNLKALLDISDLKTKLLIEQINKDKADILMATTAVAKWKSAYEGVANAHQTVEPPKNGTGPSREKVTFDKDFGYIGVNGYTLTNPAEAWVHVQQNRPLRFTLALAQTKDKAWKTYVTSSEENISLDVKVSAVNPYVLEPKWYEFLEFNAQLGAGGDGVLAGIGAGMKVGHFTIGPNLWLTVDSKVSKFYGASFSWRLFERN